MNGMTLSYHIYICVGANAKINVNGLQLYLTCPFFFIRTRGIMLSRAATMANRGCYTVVTSLQ